MYILHLRFGRRRAGLLLLAFARRSRRCALPSRLGSAGYRWWIPCLVSSALMRPIVSSSFFRASSLRFHRVLEVSTMSWKLVSGVGPILRVFEDLCREL